jgi:hypothetical protein
MKIMMTKPNQTETIVEISGTRYCRQNYVDGSGFECVMYKVERNTKKGMVWAMIPEWKCRSMKSVIESAIRKNKG